MHKQIPHVKSIGNRYESILINYSVLLSQKLTCTHRYLPVLPSLIVKTITSGVDGLLLKTQTLLTFHDKQVF